MNRCEMCETAPTAGYLCGYCSGEFRSRLLRLPAVYAELEEMSLPAARVPDEPSVRTGGMTASPVLGNRHSSDARGQFRLLLSWWLALRKDRGRPEPEVDTESSRLVALAAGELAESVSWIASDWPAAGDCAREIRDLYKDAASVTGYDPAPLGLCPTAGAGGRCGGVLWRKAQELIACSSCRATYPIGVWVLLRLEQGKALREQAGAAEEAA